MPLSIPGGKQYQVTHRNLPSDYAMQMLEAASDHYTLCFIINGDRRVITPTMNYVLHPGSATTMAPGLYHRTLSASGQEYESILVKFKYDFVKNFIDRLGNYIFDEIYKSPAKTFDEKEAEFLLSMAYELVNIENSVSQDTATEQELKLKDMKFECTLYSILIYIYEHGRECIESRAHNTPLTKPIIDAVYYIESNYSKNLLIQEVAQASGYSVFYFSRLFQAQLGSSFSEYVTNVRLKHVKNDLLTTNKSITEIALQNGFSYPGNMTNCFKKAFNITPLQYRKASVK